MPFLTRVELQLDLFRAAPNPHLLLRENDWNSVLSRAGWLPKISASILCNNKPVPMLCRPQEDSSLSRSHAGSRRWRNQVNLFARKHRPSPRRRERKSSQAQVLLQIDYLPSHSLVDDGDNNIHAL